MGLDIKMKKIIDNGGCTVCVLVNSTNIIGKI